MNRSDGPDRDIHATEESLRRFMEEVRREEAAPTDLWQRVAARMPASTAQIVEVPGAETGREALARWLPRRRFAMVGVLAASLALLTFALLAPWGTESRTATAAEILQRAELAATVPQVAGIDSLILTQQTTSYSLSDGSRDVPTTVSELALWYEAPDRLRIEQVRTASGDTGHGVLLMYLWTGSEYWRYRGDTGHAAVYRQDPAAQIYHQGAIIGQAPSLVAHSTDGVTAPSTDVDRYVLACRTATVVGSDEVSGRTADIVELGRPRCGVPTPWADGRTVLWVDRDTGLVLASEQYALDGHLTQRVEVTSVELNSTIDETRWSFTPPSDTTVNDLRGADQPAGGGSARVHPALPSITLEEARAEATFSVLVPVSVPDGFELETVEHHWANEAAREHRAHADWVLLRYADEAGNWLAISQGFGGTGLALISGRHLSSPPPPAEFTGTIEVNGALAHWVDGAGSRTQWYPSVMLSLGWQEARMGDGVEHLESGDLRVGSPLHVGIASNVLDLEALVTIAESLE